MGLGMFGHVFVQRPADGPFLVAEVGLHDRRQPVELTPDRLHCGAVRHGGRVGELADAREDRGDHPVVLDQLRDSPGEIRALSHEGSEDPLVFAEVVCRQRVAESEAVGHECVIAHPALPEARPDLSDLMTESSMCRGELQTKGDHAIAFLGSHGWRSLRFNTSMLDAVRHQHAMLPPADHIPRSGGKPVQSIG